MAAKRKTPAPLIRWSAALRNLHALTIRQPWAWLVVNGYKDIENRSWSAPFGTRSILIHAGLNRQDVSGDRLCKIEAEFRIKLPRDYYYGGIVGVVDIQACSVWSHSLWHRPGQTGWMLVRPRQLRYRRCSGTQKLFRPLFE